MNFKLRSLVAATLAGSMMMGFGANAMADSTTDIVNALVSKGVLTEEEGALLTKGRTDEAAGQAKALKKASKLKVSDAIDNATVYGDIRVRSEMRKGENITTEEDKDRLRNRYKISFGVKTEAGKFYSDLAFAMGDHGRSDNATFGGASTAKGPFNDKEKLFVKTAMLGWKATDWLALEAGRLKNPLYTTQMVWDGDLTLEGLVEKAKFNVGDSKIFLTAVQSQYLGDQIKHSGSTADVQDAWLYAFQAGAETPISTNAAAKVALTYTTHSGKKGVTFQPLVGTGTSSAAGVNNLKTIEIPAEINFKTEGALSYKVFGDFVYNTKGDERAAAACAESSSNCNKAVDDTAWMFGVGIASKAAKEAKSGDWDARVWYQDVGVYSVDPNAVDSDFMDSKVNMEGVVFKAGYYINENVIVNLAAGHGKRKNDQYTTAGIAGDIGYDMNNYDLYQLDVTYKF